MDLVEVEWFQGSESLDIEKAQSDGDGQEWDKNGHDHEVEAALGTLAS